MDPTVPEIAWRILREMGVGDPRELKLRKAPAVGRTSAEAIEKGRLYVATFKGEERVVDPSTYAALLAAGCSED